MSSGICWQADLRGSAALARPCVVLTHYDGTWAGKRERPCLCVCLPGLGLSSLESEVSSTCLRSWLCLLSCQAVWPGHSASESPWNLARAGAQTSLLCGSLEATKAAISTIPARGCVSQKGSNKTQAVQQQLWNKRNPGWRGGEGGGGAGCFLSCIINQLSADVDDANPEEELFFLG